MSDDRSVTPETVREEHLQEVNQVAHWLYVASVLGVSLVAMLAFIALMGANS
jgi:hypothetical protein